MLIRKEAEMVRTDSRYDTNSGAPALNCPFSPGEAEQARESVSPGDGTDSAIPGWDNLWVDLGGEG